MASDQTFVDFITEHIQLEGVQARKMFGEYELYAGEVKLYASSKLVRFKFQ